VTNAEYLGFMQKQGYRTRRYWGDAGWNWLMQVAPQAPHHWRQDATGSWYALTPGGAEAIIGSATVYGVSYYEAQAYAAYAGCRLQTEIEWEHAVTSDQAMDDSRGQAWEWCSNTFYAYPGFKPFPYDRYSCPWFDGNHYTMRGGSLYTSEFLKRPTFRNFYTPEKRHIFAGIRLAGK
jgi:iron(II)-dependent oxidoreductase